MKKILVICTCFLLLFGCTTKNTPENVVDKFFAAYNDADIEGLFDCIEPSKADAYKALIKLTGDITDIDLSSILQLGPLIGNNDKIQYEIVSTKIDGKQAIVTITDIDHTELKEIELVQVDGDWYIVEDQDF